MIAINRTSVENEAADICTNGQKREKQSKEPYLNTV